MRKNFRKRLADKKDESLAFHRSFIYSIAITFVFSLAPLKAQQEIGRWTYIAETTDSEQIFIDKDQVKLSNGNPAAWIKIIFPKGKYRLEFHEYECQVLSRYRTLRYFDYDEWGRLIRSGDSPAATWVSIAPDTVDEILKNRLCGKNSHSVAGPIPREENRRASQDHLGIVLPPVLPPAGRPIPSEENGRAPSISTETNRTQPQLDIGVDTVTVTATSANLREEASVQSVVIRELRKGEVLVLLNRVPVGSWYNVIYIKSGEEGWVHSSTVFPYYTNNRKENLTIPGRNTGGYRNPTLEVKNDSEKIMTLKLGETRYIFSSQEAKTIPLPPGRYGFHASAPNVIPDFGEQNFEAGYTYTWRFYIVTVRK